MKQLILPEKRGTWNAAVESGTQVDSAGPENGGPHRVPDQRQEGGEDPDQERLIKNLKLKD